MYGNKFYNPESIIPPDLARGGVEDYLKAKSIRDAEDEADRQDAAYVGPRGQAAMDRMRKRGHLPAYDETKGLKALSPYSPLDLLSKAQSDADASVPGKVDRSLAGTKLDVAMKQAGYAKDNNDNYIKGGKAATTDDVNKIMDAFSGRGIDEKIYQIQKGNEATSKENAAIEARNADRFNNAQEQRGSVEKGPSEYAPEPSAPSVKGEDLKSYAHEPTHTELMDKTGEAKSIKSLGDYKEEFGKLYRQTLNENIAKNQGKLLQDQSSLNAGDIFNKAMNDEHNTNLALGRSIDWIKHNVKDPNKRDELINDLMVFHAPDAAEVGPTGVSKKPYDLEMRMAMKPEKKGVALGSGYMPNIEGTGAMQIIYDKGYVNAFRQLTTDPEGFLKLNGDSISPVNKEMIKKYAAEMKKPEKIRDLGFIETFNRKYSPLMSKGASDLVRDPNEDTVKPIEDNRSIATKVTDTFAKITGGKKSPEGIALEQNAAAVKAKVPVTSYGVALQDITSKVKGGSALAEGGTPPAEKTKVKIPGGSGSVTPKTKVDEKKKPRE